MGSPWSVSLLRHAASGSFPEAFIVIVYIRLGGQIGKYNRLIIPHLSRPHHDKWYPPHNPPSSKAAEEVRE